MFGIYLICAHSSKQHLIEKFETEEEALRIKEKYIIDKDEKVIVKPI